MAQKLLLSLKLGPLFLSRSALNNSLIALPLDVRQKAVCLHLARLVAADGEGATRLIEVTVSGAADLSQARKAARAVVSSSLVKAAVHGADPNWGRVVAAVGRSGADMDEDKIDLFIGDIQVVRAGRPLKSGKRAVSQLLRGKEVNLGLNLNLGDGSATAWGCDLSPEYVAINSKYMT